jgi:DNA-binding response OmpR family regulator
MLDAGADDYVVKPFTARQIDARVRAVLRRVGTSTSGGDPAVTVGELCIDPTSREATLAGNGLDLSRKEFDLLLALARRPGEVVSKQDLLAEVWRQPWGARTVPSTYTCPGCDASSARPPRRRAICTASVVSASS